MTTTLRLSALVGLLCLALAVPAQAAKSSLGEYERGNPNAPITVTEYSSITCSHCAKFINDIMPEIEKKYINTGKVHWIHRDFPIDGISLKGAALGACLPKDKYPPFMTVLFKNRDSWLRNAKPETVMLQYAMLAGLTKEKGDACLQDGALMDKLIAKRTEAMNKYNIQGTPTFIVNDGEDRIVGAQTFGAFAESFEKILAKKKK